MAKELTTEERLKLAEAALLGFGVLWCEADEAFEAGYYLTPVHKNAATRPVTEPIDSLLCEWIKNYDATIRLEYTGKPLTFVFTAQQNGVKELEESVTLNPHEAKR